MPYRPTPRQLEYLVALIEARHFGEAAKLCNVSQPTLSVQVALLEEQLGTILIDRASSPLAPTAIGAEVVAAAKAVLSGIDELVTLARTGHENLGGSVRLGMASTFGPYFMPAFLPRLHARYAGLKIYLFEDRPAALENKIRLGEIDCALGPIPEDRDKFGFQTVCREEILVGIPRNHRLGGADEIELGDLAGEVLLTLGKGHRLMNDVHNLAHAAGAYFSDNYEGTSLDAIRQMVSIEMGLSLFPEYYIRSEFAKERNVSLARISGRPMHRDIGCYWRLASPRAGHYQVLAEIAEAIAKVPP